MLTVVQADGKWKVFQSNPGFSDFNVCTHRFTHMGSCTARKNILSFSGCPEKIVFPKRLHWNMIFLVLSGKMIFLFSENMILHVRRKMKDDLS